MCSRWRVSNQDGIAVLGIAIALSLLCITIMMLPKAASGISQAVAKITKYSTLRAIRNNITANLTDGDAWVFSQADAENSQLHRCYTSPYPDCTGFTSAIRLRNSLDEIYYDPLTSAAAGFDTNHDVCTTFDQTDTCLFRAEIIWSADCAGVVPCIQPNGIVTVNFTISNQGGTTFGFVDMQPFSMTIEVF